MGSDTISVAGGGVEGQGLPIRKGQGSPPAIDSCNSCNSSNLCNPEMDLSVPSSLLKKPPGEGTGPTGPSKSGVIPVGRVP
jgi:hypothetical protein